MPRTQFRPTSGHKETTDWSTTLGGLILAAAVTVLIAMIARYGNTHKRPAPLLIDLVDMNQRKEDRRRECGQFRSLLDHFPSGTVVDVRTYDANCVRLFNGTPVEGNELQATEDQIIKGKPHVAPHTCPAVALQQVLPDVQKAASEGRAVFIMMSTDGDDTNPTATMKQAKALAHAANVRAVWVTPIAATGNQRNIVERAYGPLGRRAIVSAPTDQKAGRDKFLRSLNEQ